MKLPENLYPHRYAQEVHREGKYFDNIRSAAEFENAAPGEEFEIELYLVPDENTPTVRVQHLGETLGELPAEDAQEWWPVLTAIKAKEYAQMDTSVDARIWTCPDWEDRFYASVRLEMPTVDTALEFAIEDVLEFKASDIRSLPPLPPNRPYVQPSEPVPLVRNDYQVDIEHNPSRITQGKAKSKRTAWILWLLTGFVGGHRYYTENYLYAFFMTVTIGGGGWWWIVDALFINRRIDSINSNGIH